MSTISGGLVHTFIRGGFLSGVALVVMEGSSPLHSLCVVNSFVVFYCNIYDISLLDFKLFFYFLD